MKLLLFSLILSLLLSACAPSRPTNDPITTSHHSDPPEISETEKGTEPWTSEPAATEPSVTDPETTAPIQTDPVTSAPETNPVTVPPETEPSKDTSPPILPPPSTDPPDTLPPERYPEDYAWVDHNLESTYFGTVIPEGTMEGAEYLNRIVFLGDSTTYGLRYYGILPGGKQTGNVWVPKNGTLTLHDVPKAKVYLADVNREMTLTDALTERKPEILVITLGVNGIGWMKQEVFVAEYRELIEAVRASSPDTVILLQSIFPVRPDYAKLDSINNKKISQANAWIAALAQEYGLGYLNTAEGCLLNEHGYLKAGYDSGDGMHLMPDVYRRIVDYVLRHPVLILTDPMM